MGGSYVTEGVSWRGDMDYESLLVLALSLLRLGFPLKHTPVMISSPAMGLNAVGQINMK
jgi:hypothetical protein